MIKRFDKMKKSKRGSLLIIVVLVLALAMIFISAAMMLTQSTKSRLYDNAMSSQARLTVTAASEVFLEALEMQEITDDQFDRMLLGADLKSPKWGPYNGSNPRTRIKMVIPGVPGMSETDPENCTYLDLYYPVNDNADKKIVFADFTTIIGDEIESVQIRLKVDPEKKNNVANNFSNQIEIASSIGVSQLRFSSGVGMYDYNVYKKGSPRDNTILCRDNYFENADSSSMFFSDIVVAGTDTKDAVFCYGNKVGLYGDFIFLDHAYFTTHASNQTGAWGIFGDVYFIGEPNSTDDVSLLDDTSLKFCKAGGFDSFSDSSKFVFSGRRVQDKEDYWNSPQGRDFSDDAQRVTQLFKNYSASLGYGNPDRAYFVDKSGKTLATVSGVSTQGISGSAYTVKNSTLTSDDYSNTGFYDSSFNGTAYTVTDKVNYYQNTYKASNSSFPTAENVFKQISMDVVVNGKTETKTLSTTYPYAPTDPKYKELDLSPKTPGGKGVYVKGGSITLSAGYYLIKGVSTESTRKPGDKPFVIYIDGSTAEEYRFWFEGGKTFNLNSVVFAVYNADADTAKHSVIFVLEKDAKVLLGGNNTNSDLAGADNDVLCTSGFLSMPRGGKTAVENEIAGSYSAQAVSHKKTADTNWTYFNGKDIKYSQYYDGKNRPAIFIYGVDGNEFKVSYGTILEAYVGMYGSGSFGVKEGTPNIEIEDGKKTNANYAGNLGAIIPIYGRIEAASFKNGQTGNNPIGNVLMPYCPQPATDAKINPKRPAVSKYHVTDVIYYYNTPT